MFFLIDNGHGSNTAGKRSPDGSLREWSYTRDIASRIVALLTEAGHKAQLVTPEAEDVALSERVRRINKECLMRGASNVVAVSIHVNAAPGDDKEWHNARGFCAFVCRDASVRSKHLAQLLTNNAHEAGMKGNRWTPFCGYWTQDLYICKHTKCAAVLSENLFMDNREDCAFLLSEEGRATVARVHVDALLAYAEKWD